MRLLVFVACIGLVNCLDLPWTQATSSSDFAPVRAPGRVLSQCDHEPVNNMDCIKGEDGKAACSYCEFSRCWERKNASFFDEENCNKKRPDASVCLDLKSPNPIQCPEDAVLSWQVPEAQIKQDSKFSIRASLDFGKLADDVVLAPCAGKQDSARGKILHANVHGCVKSTTTWWCSELIPAYQPESVVTSPSKCMNESKSSEFIMTIDQSTMSQPNEWIVYVHYTFYATDKSTGLLSKWHMTTGRTFLVEGRELELGSTGQSVVSVSAVILLMTCLMCLVGLSIWHKHWVMVASSVEMNLLTIFGGVLGALAVLTFVELSDFFCTARQWVLPFAFDLLIVPMCLKTYRVHRIFNNQKMRAVKISNRLLVGWTLVVLLFDFLFNLAWTLTPGARLSAGREYSAIDGNAFQLECVSEDERLQAIFTTLSIVLHLIPCLMLTIFAYKIRLSFKYAQYNKKLGEFDESLFIMLAMLNVSVTSLFVISFQYLIESDPAAVALLRGCGTAWIAFLTVVLMYVPKFIRIYGWEGDAPVVQDSNSASMSSSFPHKEEDTKSSTLSYSAEGHA